MEKLEGNFSNNLSCFFPQKNAEDVVRDMLKDFAHTTKVFS